MNSSMKIKTRRESPLISGQARHFPHLSKGTLGVCLDSFLFILNFIEVKFVYLDNMIWKQNIEYNEYQVIPSIEKLCIR